MLIDSLISIALFIFIDWVILIDFLTFIDLLNYWKPEVIGWWKVNKPQDQSTRWDGQPGFRKRKNAPQKGQIFHVQHVERNLVKDTIWPAMLKKFMSKRCHTNAHCVIGALSGLKECRGTEQFTTISYVIFVMHLSATGTKCLNTEKMFMEKIGTLTQ